jgi:cystathionine beta-lyase/cystathionine gamma-synthase
MDEHFSTLAVHAAESPDKTTGAVAPIVVRSKTFAQRIGVDQQFHYSRGNNPTRNQLADKLAILENGKYACCFSSGNAATAAFLLSLNPGDHILFCQEVYGGTYRLMEEMMVKFGVTGSYVDFTNEESILSNIRPNTKWLFVETPTNPSLHIIDLDMVNRISKKLGIPFVVDSTFSPPCCTRPLDYGADVVIQSLSKYIAGHNDVLAGALITNNKDLFDKFWFIFRTVGAVLSPDECYRVLQGVKTLPMRWERVSRTAISLAKELNGHDKIKKVFYPGLESHPGYRLAFRQMRRGFGAVLSFELKDDYHKDIKKFVDTVLDNSHIIYAESLASPETILAYPPDMSHKSVPRDVRLPMGITDGFFRLSVGFEEPIDIYRGLKAGLDIL